MRRYDEIGIRMKNFYEDIPKTKLMRRTPVIIRIDGRTFHTFTRGFEKPFDYTLMSAMQATMKDICQKVQGCQMGYLQSDEISLLLTDYDELDTDAWFDYEVEKLCSVAASMATMYFNKEFQIAVENENKDNQAHAAHEKAMELGAMFDARCFNIPKEEVCNYFYWRQIDAERNAIQMAGRAVFTHKELLNCSSQQIKDRLLEEKGVRFESYPIMAKRGSCCVRARFSKTEQKFLLYEFGGWHIDKEIPKFKGEDRKYIERYI